MEEKLVGLAKECNIYVDYKNKLLKIVWRNELFEDGRFRELLILFTDLTKKYQPQSIFVDARLLNIPISPETQVWHDEVIVPLFIESGVKRMGFLTPMNVSSEKSHKRIFDESDVKAKLDTRFFNLEEKALAFLLEKQIVPKHN